MSMFSELFIQHVAAELCCEYKEIRTIFDNFIDEELKENPGLSVFGDYFIKYTALKSSNTFEGVKTSFGNFSEKSSNIPIAHKIEKVNKSVVKKTPSVKRTASLETKPVAKTQRVVKEKHTCCRLPRNSTEKCGKNAKNKVINDVGEEVWYCGTEKSGCYKIIHAAMNRIKTKPIDVKIPAPKKATSSAAPTLKSNKVVSKKNTVKLVNTVVKREGLNLRFMDIDGERIHYHPESRIAFYKETQEAYGLLQDEKIVDFDDKALRFIEANNLTVCEKKTTNASEIVDLDVEDDDLFFD